MTHVYDNIILFGKRVEKWSATICRVNGDLKMVMCYLGDLSKSQARAARKAFARKGWTRYASSPRLPDYGRGKR
jgi:hypothetical protein